MTVAPVLAPIALSSRVCPASGLCGWTLTSATSRLRPSCCTPAIRGLMRLEARARQRRSQDVAGGEGGGGAGEHHGPAMVGLLDQRQDGPP